MKLGFETLCNNVLGQGVLLERQEHAPGDGRDDHLRHERAELGVDVAHGLHGLGEGVLELPLKPSRQRAAF